MNGGLFADVTLLRDQQFVQDGIGYGGGRDVVDVHSVKNCMHLRFWREQQLGWKFSEKRNAGHVERHGAVHETAIGSRKKIARCQDRGGLSQCQGSDAGHGIAIFQRRHHLFGVPGAILGTD